LFSLFFISANAQNVELSLGTGLAVPVSEKSFNDDFNPSYNFNFGAAYKLSGGNKLRFAAQFNNFPLERVSDEELTITSIKLDYIIALDRGAGINPYAVLGAGIYMLNFAGASESNIGFGLGGGFTTRLGGSPNTNLFIEAQINYNANEGSAKMYLPVMVGLNIGL
jgi:hypothetical protein